MKLNRTYLFIAISSLALVAVLVIQVSWTLQTARMKEELFNEKANMVLAKTAEALSYDTAVCQGLRAGISSSAKHKADSLFSHYMALYKVQVGYYFEVRPDTSRQQHLQLKALYPYQQGSYTTCLDDGASKNRLELKLVFPGKAQFIRAEMGAPFIASVVLILVVLVMSWRTTLSLFKEKQISEHTTDFLNNMTHEFKTPLTNIALAGRMMLKDQNIGQEEKIKHYSTIILEENEKLKRQVEQVLGMTALERGEIPLQRTEVDVHHLIQQALKGLAIQLEHRKGDATLSLEASNPTVLADKTHLENAFCNLLDNAIKYSAEKPELAICSFNKGEHVVIMIADKGIGIDKAYQKKVFDTFFRVPTGDVHDVKGFGLGLAYTKKIIGLHGGTIGLESEKGKGTAITITLPNA